MGVSRSILCTPVVVGQHKLFSPRRLQQKQEQDLGGTPSLTRLEEGRQLR